MANASKVFAFAKLLGWARLATYQFVLTIVLQILVVDGAIVKSTDVIVTMDLEVFNFFFIFFYFSLHVNGNISNIGSIIFKTIGVSERCHLIFMIYLYSLLLL